MGAITILSAIENWRYMARDIVDDIRGWRDTTKDRLERRNESLRTAWPTQRDYDGFSTDTTILVSAAVEVVPSLDISALTTIHTAATNWLATRSANDLPSQQKLETELARALVIVGALQSEFYRQVTGHRIGDSLGDQRNATVTLAPEGNGETDKGYTCGDDYASVNWFRTVYSFTANQAPVVKMLIEHYERGVPDVRDETLLSAVDAASPPERLSIVFRKSPAWNTMIVGGGSRGTHRVAPPK